MGYMTLLVRGQIPLKAYDQGDDIQVIIGGVPNAERWFSKYQGESFIIAAQRCFMRIAEEKETDILPLVPCK